MISWRPPENGQREGGKGFQFLDRFQDDHRQTGGRSTDTQLRTGEERHDNPAHDARDDPAEEGGAGGQRHSQTQREGDQKNDQASWKVRTGRRHSWQSDPRTEGGLGRG